MQSVTYRIRTVLHRADYLLVVTNAQNHVQNTVFSETAQHYILQLSSLFLSLLLYLVFYSTCIVIWEEIKMIASEDDALYEAAKKVIMQTGRNTPVRCTFLVFTSLLILSGRRIYQFIP